MSAVQKMTIGSKIGISLFVIGLILLITGVCITSYSYISPDSLKDWNVQNLTSEMSVGNGLTVMGLSLCSFGLFLYYVK